MNTENFAPRFDRPKKDRKGSLQSLFLSLANGTDVHHFSGKREMGVCTKTKAAFNRQATAGTGNVSGPNRDGMLGSMLLEGILGSALSPLLPLFFRAFDFTAAVEAADEFWMDRRQASQPAPAPEFSYF